MEQTDTYAKSGVLAVCHIVFRSRLIPKMCGNLRTKLLYVTVSLGAPTGDFLCSLLT